MRKKQHTDEEKEEELFGLGGGMTKASPKVLGRQHLNFPSLIQVDMLHLLRIPYY